MEKQAKIRKSRAKASTVQSADVSAVLAGQRPAAGSGRRATPFPIVGIGASAGGLEALEHFLKEVPAHSGMAFVVIQHLDPDYKGMLPELLQRTTAMPVVQARSRQKVRPDSVYVIPPNRDLSILHDTLYLLDPVAPRGLRLPIDFFLRSLADDRHENAVGVILSGMGSDGTLGLRAIKEAGGLVLAQDPASAKFDAMPRSAIDSGLVDIVGPAQELPRRIADTLGREPLMYPTGVPIKVETAAQKSAFDKICILLRERTGHDFSLYKKSTLYRRIERRMAIHQLERLSEYVRCLREIPIEADLLFRELLIGVTSFFRDPASWEYLRDVALPELLARYPAGKPLRAWVAGCSTGEEAFSLAIIFREALEHMKHPARYSLQIFATDLDPDAVDNARKSLYPANIAADVSAERLKRFFIDEGGSYRVGKEIREMVVFAPQNLIMDPPFTNLDILCCRNLLIYLGAELQKKLLPLFHYSLRPGGILMLGSAETIGSYHDLFAPIESKARLFRRSSGMLRTVALEFPTRSISTRTEIPMDTKIEAPVANLQLAADHLLLKQFTPAAVLVNGAGDLVYISGRTGKYLEPAAGKVNWNILAMAREGLRTELSLALPRAFQHGEAVICRNLKVDPNGGQQAVDVTVHPIHEPDALRGMAMVVFNDVVPPLPEPASRRRRGPRGEAQVEAEQALAQANQAMQALREQMQTSQEELKSANEELQSTNEELQSTNEELTTSKEELQSLNEELQTVNVELQSKLDELSCANNDMKNLLNSTDIATVFLDNALHVRRFTSPATRLFKLIPGDIGRPLSDIVNDLVYPGLLNDAERVLQSLVFSNREVATGDGRWYEVKIMPYRTLENVIDGVVITSTDITRAKLLEAELRGACLDIEEKP